MDKMIQTKNYYADCRKQKIKTQKIIQESWKITDISDELWLLA